MSKDIIHLQNAHVTQLTKDNERSAWKVQRNGDNEALAELPGELNEAQVFAIMEFGRKFEMIAFNAGIQWGKNLTVDWDTRIAGLKNSIKRLSAENERLAGIIENLTRKEDSDGNRSSN